MKMLLISILILLTLRAFAPEAKRMLIEKAEKISKFDKIIKAVTWIESKHGKYIFNPTEGAVGWFQIRQCRVDDYNKQIKGNYRLEDFYDYELSRKMFVWYAEQIQDIDLVIMRWNGSGPATREYLKRVKAVI
jgi:hypothetical protein